MGPGPYPPGPPGPAPAPPPPRMALAMGDMTSGAIIMVRRASQFILRFFSCCLRRTLANSSSFWCL